MQSFLQNETPKHVLIRRDPSTKKISVWLAAPHDADTKNSLTFSKKGATINPKDMGLSLLYQAGIPPDMERLTQDATEQALELQRKRAEALESKKSSITSTPVQTSTPKKEGPEFQGTWAGCWTLYALDFYDVD